MRNLLASFLLILCAFNSTAQSKPKSFTKSGTKVGSINRDLGTMKGVTLETDSSNFQQNYGDSSLVDLEFVPEDDLCWVIVTVDSDIIEVISIANNDEQGKDPIVDIITPQKFDYTYAIPLYPMHYLFFRTPYGVTSFAYVYKATNRTGNLLLNGKIQFVFREGEILDEWNFPPPDYFKNRIQWKYDPKKISR